MKEDKEMMEEHARRLKWDGDIEEKEEESSIDSAQRTSRRSRMAERSS